MTAAEHYQHGADTGMAHPYCCSMILTNMEQIRGYGPILFLVSFACLIINRGQWNSGKREWVKPRFLRSMPFTALAIIGKSLLLTSAAA